jgi:hypothetical protein
VVKVSENAEASTSLNNGEDVVFTTLFVNDKKADFIVEPEFSLWQGSISFLNLLPGGSNVDPSEFQIIGPWNEWTEGAVLGLSGAFDIALPTYVSVSKIYVRNISAGASTTIIARARLRYITNFDKARLT